MHLSVTSGSTRLNSQFAFDRDDKYTGDTIGCLNVDEQRLRLTYGQMIVVTEDL